MYFQVGPLSLKLGNLFPDMRMHIISPRYRNLWGLGFEKGTVASYFHANVMQYMANSLWTCDVFLMWKLFLQERFDSSVFDFIPQISIFSHFHWGHAATLTPVLVISAIGAVGGSWCTSTVAAWLCGWIWVLSGKVVGSPNKSPHSVLVMFILCNSCFKF